MNVRESDSTLRCPESLKVLSDDGKLMLSWHENISKPPPRVVATRITRGTKATSTFLTMVEEA